MLSKGNMIKLKLILILIIHFTEYVVADLMVTLPSGQIEGYAKTTTAGKVYHAFQGIPLAKSPIGNLRFQAPVPAPKWNGVLKTQREKGFCYSVYINGNDQTEDCLYINVYTPVLNTKNTSQLPVMFYIYGGGFRGGGASSGAYGPDFLLEEDIVVIETNYRTGPFGFLSTGDTVIPGNAGMKDMILGLKWTKENIALFGGDPRKVTIFGQSAGGASVGLLVISKAAAGLFRGGIAHSGSGLSNWAYLSNPMAYASELVSKIRKPSSNSSSEILKILQSATAAQIHSASQQMTVTKDALPVIEVAHEGAFLTKPMYQSLETGDFNKVPLFIGGNSEEFITLADNMTDLKARAVGYETDPARLTPPSFNIQDRNKLKIIGDEIKKIYITDGSKWQDHLGLTIAHRSESHFFNPCVRHAEIQSKYTDVYFYKFSYAGKMGMNLNHHLEGAEMCTHGEELYYIFKRVVGTYDNSKFTQFSNDDVLTHKRMVKWWTNFAKYLNPTPEKATLFQNLIWPKVKPNNVQYIDIDKTLSIKSHIKNDRYLRWTQLYEKYAVAPHVTF